MKEVDFQTVLRLVNTGKLNFYNFYDVDQNATQYYCSNYYKDNLKDSLDNYQPLSIVFTDIEVYTRNEEVTISNMSIGAYPVHSISCYSTSTDEYRVYFLGEVKVTESDIISRLKSDGYISDDINLKIVTYDGELNLIKDYFSYLKTIDPMILSGYNSDKFDYPYLYNRLKYLLRDDKAVGEIISRFGVVEKDKLYDDEIVIPEYVILDVMRLLKPGDEGGFGYGKKYHSYSLDATAERVLNLRKVFHSVPLDTLYDTNPDEYLYYNLVDVILTKRINDVLKHIELHNILRRALKTTLSLSKVGISKMIDTYVNTVLLSQNKHFRFGISTEKVKQIGPNKIKNIEKYNKHKKPTSITKDDYRSIVFKYPGAYVKSPKPSIINDGSLIIDLDATSLYPSMILQHNISFDVIVGQIINPGLYKFLEFVKSNMGKPIPHNVLDAVSTMISKNVDAANKTQAESKTFYIFYYLLDFLLKSGYKFEDICEPKDEGGAILLKNYLIHLLDLLNSIHINTTKDYNKFAYDYIFSPETIKSNYKYVVVYTNPFGSNSKLLFMTIPEFEKYISNYCFTISGAIFKKHDQQLGLFTELIKDLRKMRVEYKKLRDKYPVDSIEYFRYDLLQNSVKITANSIYGVYGLSKFRYSSSLLAQAITLQGKLINKIAQYIAEDYIRKKSS